MNQTKQTSVAKNTVFQKPTTFPFTITALVVYVGVEGQHTHIGGCQTPIQ